MKYSVLIRNNETGEERLWRSGKDDDWNNAGHYLWIEGNFACDCNRHLEFLRAGGPGPPGDPHWNKAEHECGDSAYSVPWAELEDGTRVEVDGVSDSATASNKGE